MFFFSQVGKTTVGVKMMIDEVSGDLVGSSIGQERVVLFRKEEFDLAGTNHTERDHESLKMMTAKLFLMPSLFNDGTD